MKVKIGKYEIDHPGFDTLDEAVKFVKTNHPELDEVLIKKNVKSLVNGKSSSEKPAIGSEKGDKPNANPRKGNAGNSTLGKD